MKGDEIVQFTKEIAVKGIINYAAKRMKQAVPFQILDLIIPKERWIRSIVGGLETGLGTTLWEPLAIKLALENGFEIKNPTDLKKPIHVPEEVSKEIDNIINSRSKSKSEFKGFKARNRIRELCNTYKENPLSIEDLENPPQGRGVDVWLIKRDINYLFDIKTVRPNISGFHSYLRQILTWYFYFYAKNPNDEVYARIAFPYNPFTNKTFWLGSMGGGKPLNSESDALVENAFWDFLTGHDSSFKYIKQGLSEVGKKGLVSKELDKLIESLDINKNQKALEDYF